MSELKWAHSVQVGNQTAKQLLCFLASHSFSKPGLCFKNSTISTILEITERAVRQAKNLLIKKNLLIVEARYDSSGKQISNYMYLNIPQEYVDNYYEDIGVEGERSSSLGGHVVPPPLERSSSSHPNKEGLTISKIEENFEKKNPNNKYINNKSNNKKRERANRAPAKRGTQIPTKYCPNENHYQLAKDLGLDVMQECEKFSDYYRSRGKAMLDWDAAFRNWLRKAHDYAQAKPTQSNQGSDAFSRYQEKRRKELTQGRIIDADNGISRTDWL